MASDGHATGRVGYGTISSYAVMSLRKAVDMFNPVRLVRTHVTIPIEAFFERTLTSYRNKTSDGINSFKELVYKSGIVAVFVSAVVWISIFLYVAFYYTYMPNITHMRPVHLQFKSCDELPGVCSFPSAHVQLTRRNQMLMVGQPYRIRLVLDMPESQANKELGMFMVCAQMRAHGGTLVSSSCRSAMLRHRSPLHQLLRTIVLAPLLLASLNEEKQMLQVELFSDFEEDQSVPVTDAYVELQSRHAQLYGAALHIEAHFTGLRYLMFHWPVVSATLGISTNLFFVALIFVLSWYHLHEGSLADFVKVGHSEEKNEQEFPVKKIVKLEREESTFLEGASFCDSPLIEDEMKRALES